MCSWFKTGYEAVNHAYDDLPNRGPRRVWMPPETTNRFLFLDDQPFLFWEHQFQNNGTWQNWEPCRVRNKMEDVCVICDRYPDRYPYFVGYHSVISLTPYTDNKGRTWCFGRQMYGAKLGGKDKPGVLKELQRLSGKHGGRTRGLIIDAYRSGAKTETVGDRLEIVERIDPDIVVAWVKQKLLPHIEEVNKGKDDDKKLTLEKHLKWNPIEPFNFEEIIKPRTNAQLLNLFGGGGSSDNEAGTSEGSDDLDDLPY